MKRTLGIALTMVLCGAGQVLAAPITFFGVDAGPGDAAHARAATTNSDLAAASFRNAIAGFLAPVGTTGFEEFADEAATPLDVVLSNGLGAHVSGGSDTFVEDPAINPSAADPSGVTNGSGRYPISGRNYLESGRTFAITFDQPIMAFGFYGVDIGDMTAQLALTLSRGALTFPTLNVTGSPLGASILFFGFYVTDPNEAFTRIEFGNTSCGVDPRVECNDFFGFDDVSAAAASAPEPASLLLLGTGVVLLARRRYVKKQQ